jgi:hypothetical protein
MSNLAPVPGELRATIEIKRKETGKVETYEIVGHPDPEVLKKLIEESKNGSHTQRDSERRSD